MAGRLSWGNVPVVHVAHSRLFSQLRLCGQGTRGAVAVFRLKDNYVAVGRHVYCVQSGQLVKRERALVPVPQAAFCLREGCLPRTPDSWAMCVAACPARPDACPVVLASVNVRSGPESRHTRRTNLYGRLYLEFTWGGGGG